MLLESSRASHLDCRVQRKVTFDGIEVAGVDVAESNDYDFVVLAPSPLRAPRHGTSRRHKQLVAGRHLLSVFSARKFQNWCARERYVVLLC